MEINQATLQGFLQKTAPEACPSVWLIHGQDMLVEKAAIAVSQHLLGSNAREIGCDAIDGFAQNIPDLLAELNTFAMLAAAKVVIFKDARVFEAQSGQTRLIAQIEEAWQNHQTAQAAKSLLSLCNRLGLDLEQIVPQFEDHADLKALGQTLGKETILQLTAFCADQGWSTGAAENQLETLQRAVEKGFPASHFLLITVNSKVPKNLKLYKAIEQHGISVDCSVPLGERRVDKEAQQAVLRQTMEAALQKAGKRLSAQLFMELVELTGFDPRIFSHNLDKLISYVGQREVITAEDIQTLLQRTKSDPLFQLTSAVADRDLKQALFFTHSLLSSQWHALQLLAALANQIRKLLVAKGFAMSELGRNWAAGLPYNVFLQQVMPAIQAYDDQVAATILPWPVEPAGKKGKGGREASIDLRLAPNPKNTYPVYQTLLNSEKYSRQELLNALDLLSEADLRLKSTGQDPFIVMKKVVVDICG